MGYLTQLKAVSFAAGVATAGAFYVSTRVNVLAVMLLLELALLAALANQPLMPDLNETLACTAATSMAINS